MVNFQKTYTGYLSVPFQFCVILFLGKGLSVNISINKMPIKHLPKYFELLMHKDFYLLS